MTRGMTGRVDLPPAEIIAGVDEAGRGPLAGPVVAAAVILDSKRPVAGLDDSKKLSATRREELANQIKASALSCAIAWSDRSEIDALNILQATMLAMRRAVSGLALTPSRVLVDGNRCPHLAHPAEAIVGGDGKIAAIAAASILAKVWRDEQMRRIHAMYPSYGFDRHKGYPTADHLERLRLHGPCPQHRQSFAPVRESRK